MERMKSGSKLERLLREGKFVVTAELGPPKGPDMAFVEKKAEYLRNAVDAINVTDNQTAVVHMSSIATGAHLVRMGIEPVIQMTCRDRNRIALQSDLFGASALGIRGVLCISGDHQSEGNQKGARRVYDIDSIQFVSMAKRLRDEKKILGTEDPVRGDLPLFIGAAANPFAKPYEFRALRLRKKVEAGADFIQTQCIYDMRIFREWMKIVTDMGIHERCYIMAGVMPLKSLNMTMHMVEKVPGIIIPKELQKRMSGVPKEKAPEEGVKICLEIIEQIREIEGIAGIHIMAVEWEKKVAEIVERAGLFPRPV